MLSIKQGSIKNYFVMTRPVIEPQSPGLLKWLNGYRWSLEELEATTSGERRMRDNLIETFKIINQISNYARYFLKFLLKLEIHSSARF